MTEGALRDRLKKAQEPEADGRADQPTALDGSEAAVRVIHEYLGDGPLTGEGRCCQAREIYRVLVRDHGYTGNYKAVARLQLLASSVSPVNAKTTVKNLP